MRIALVGLGDIARKAYLPLLACDERVTPLLCTRDGATLATLARRYRVSETYSSYRALLAAHPDAVMIHAATPAHAPLAEAALQAGIPVFVDKPLCDSAAGVERLAELAMQRDLPLFVGFNRRYLPALAELRRQPLTELIWQKHRHALPGGARSFFFDDFIHVLDGLCHYGGRPEGEARLLARAAAQPGALAGVSVSWRTRHGWCQGSMNRSAGVTEERIDGYAENLSLHVEQCSRGWLTRGKAVQAIGGGEWTPMLEQRGFVAMLEHWLALLNTGRCDSALLDSYVASHALAESLLGQLQPKR